MTETPEFSRVVRVDSLPRDGLTQKIAADAAERAALAKRFNLVELGALDAELRIVRSGRGVRVRGEARARATQTCVVTLEPFEVDVVEDIDVRFAPPPAERSAPVADEEIRYDAEDEPDPLIDGRVDIGELAAEFIALGLDPHPRKPGVEFEGQEDADRAHSPFASLTGLHDRNEPE